MLPQFLRVRTRSGPLCQHRASTKFEASGGSLMSCPSCRLCGAELRRTFVDLGMSPPCELILGADQLDVGETFYPLHVRICEQCLLVQLPAYIPADEIFTDEYAYYSSYSDSWVQHARRFV
ncbi:MAG: class I SAM-dependent methyltransferase, partial [Janthinobacterium lividum]